MNKKLRSLGKTRKLLANLENKINIVCDYRTIKQAIKHGLILKKIHRYHQIQVIHQQHVCLY